MEKKNYLSHINDNKIETFINTLDRPATSVIVMQDSPARNYVDVFTNLLTGTYHITDFECTNIKTNKVYSREWRKFMIAELDLVDTKLADQYIDNLHDYLEQDTIYGPML